MKKNTPLLTPPIVTVLGHIDHGKTTLLDYIRKSNQVAKEEGGITQHIGAYQIAVTTKEGIQKITFIDTPGHEAFSAMRSRGAEVTDLVILVVSAVEGVKPQTLESLEHIKKSQVPFIVAATKMDLPAANLERVQKHLQKAGILTENYGGEVVVVPVSAKSGKGIPQLLEMIILVTQLHGLNSSSLAGFEGVVIESELDRRRGPLGTLIVKKGTLKQGDDVYLGDKKVRIRAMFDDHGTAQTTATAGTPVRVIGFSQVPPVGSRLTQKSDALAHDHAALAMHKASMQDDKKLKIILKGDTFGSLEAITQTLGSNIQVIDARLGDITESDVLTAEGSKACVIGFNVRVSPLIKEIAQQAHILLKTYTLIYDLCDELEEVASLVKEGQQEKIMGLAKIAAVFNTSEGKIAGIKVLSGKLAKGDKVILIRAEKEVGSGRILQLKHGKDDVPKVEQGEESGARLSSSLDFTIGDVLKSINIQLIEVKLSK